MTNTPRVNAFGSRFSIHHEGDLARLWDLARTLELELFEANQMIAESDDNCARHNRYTIEEAERAAAAIRTAEGWDDKVYPSWRDRIWWLEMERALKAAQQECLEQARLNGMGGEREADLRGKVERLERENARLRDALGDMVRLYSPTAFPATHYRAKQALHPTP